MQKSTWVGLGAWTVALTTGLVSSGWPELIRPHPHVVIGLGIAGAIMLSYPGLKWVYMAQRGLHPKTDPWEHVVTNASGNKFETSLETNSGNFAGRDNNGKQIIAEHYHEAPSQAHKPIVAIPPQPRKPNLVSRGYRKVKSEDGMGWGIKGLTEFFLISVENKLSDEVDIAPSQCTCARLQFTGTFFKMEALVTKAFWHNFDGNEIDIPIGEVRSVVLGALHEGQWICCQNDLQFPSTIYESTSSYFERQIEPVSVPFLDGDIDVEVTWFSRIGGKALMKENYRISQVRPNAVVIERPI